VRFVVVGAGAIGGVVGGRLFEHGHDVVLVARGAHYEALRRSGLRLDGPDTSVTLDIRTIRDPAEIEFAEDDVIALAVKSHDTAAIVETLALSAPPTIPVFCFQNGVDNEPAVLRSFRNVYGVYVMCPALHLQPGVVYASSAPVTGVLDVGRYPAGVDDLAESVAAALCRSTFSSEATGDITRWKYSKLLGNLANAVEVVCGLSAVRGPITRRAREEGVACLEAAGIAFASPEEEAKRRGGVINPRAFGSERTTGGSSWQSVARAAGTVESDHLNGEIVLLGRLHGVATPVNEALQRQANRIAHDRLPPGTMTEEEFLQSVDD
jgi:2-dehydropantoate 2-reductase